MATITLGSQGLLEDHDVIWRIKAGADAWAGPFRLWQDVAKTIPVDLTGVTGRCELRGKLGGPQLATAAVLIAGNEVTLHVPASASQGWSVKIATGVFDVELVDSAGAVTSLCTGVLEISPNVTTGAL